MTLVTTLILTVAGPAFAQDAPDESTVDVQTIEDAKQPIPMTCRRSIGLVGGLFDPGRTWQFTGGPVYPAGSPVLGMGCDVGGSVAVSASVETLPLYVTRGIDSSEGKRQWLNISVGALLNNTGRVRLGPIASVGWKRVGLGGRMLHLPFGDDDKPTGFEYRLQAFYNGGLEVQGMVTYTLTTNRYPR